MGKRGPVPGTVKKPPGSGRQKGQLNHATADVKALAREYGADAIATLGRLAKEADTDQAKIAACRELLDRAYGRSPQMVSGDPDGEPIKHLFGWLSENSAS